jgi:hypothetical protein
MFTSIRTTTGEAVNRSRYRRRLAALVALISLCAIGQTAMPNAADAASWDVGCYMNVCQTGSATLEVTCRTVDNMNGTKTRSLTAFARVYGVGSGWLQVKYHLRAGYYGKNADTDYTSLWIGLNSSSDVFASSSTYYNNAAQRWVQVEAQFRLYVNGSWVYSPYGKYEWANHYEANGWGYANYTGSNCWLR